MFDLITKKLLTISSWFVNCVIIWVWLVLLLAISVLLAKVSCWGYDLIVNSKSPVVAHKVEEDLQTYYYCLIKYKYNQKVMAAWLSDSAPNNFGSKITAYGCKNYYGVSDVVYEVDVDTVFPNDNKILIVEQKNRDAAWKFYNEYRDVWIKTNCSIDLSLKSKQPLMEVQAEVSSNAEMEAEIGKRPYSYTVQSMCELNGEEKCVYVVTRNDGVEIIKLTNQKEAQDLIQYLEKND